MVYRFARQALVAVVALLAVGVSACSSYDHLTLTEPKGAVDKAALDPAGITLVEGYAVSATGLAFDEDDKQLDDLSLHADDTGPIGVAPGPTENTFVFYGRHAGDGVVRVRVGGDQVATIPVTVSAQ